MAVAAATGMRRSEVLALTPSAIHDGVIEIREAFKWTGRHEYSVGTPKCNSSRIIACPELVTKALSVLSHPDSPFDRYFPYDTHWLDGVIPFYNHVASLSHPEYAAAYAEITPHCLRHSLATLLLVAGIPRELIEIWMGWKKSIAGSMLANYAHPEGREMQDIADTIDRLLSPADGSSASGTCII